MPRKNEREKYITVAEFKELLAAAQENLLAYMIFYLAGNLGLRVGEVIRLRIEDIDMKNKLLNIPTLKQEGKKGIKKGSILHGQLPKTYIPLPLKQSILDKILEYLKGRKKGWMFAYDRISHIPKWRAQRLFKFYAQKIGLGPRYSIHSLRHCRGMMVQKQYKDIRTTQVMLRHKNISSTVIYTTMDLDMKREVDADIKEVE